MSDKKKKDIPAQEPENETAAPVTEETENTETAAEETTPENFTVTKEQMEKMEGLAKLVADVNDKYLRLAAEDDNYRKRSQKEKENAWTTARADTIKELLPVYDNLERALKQETADEAYAKGVQMTMTQLKTVLEKLGVEEIPAQGESFDPNVHNAVMHMEDEALGENTVVEVFQAGFKMGEKVIRHAMVKVAN